MRPIEEKTQERLAGVAPEDRVYIYNGEHIIKFLQQTFVNTSHFLKDDYVLEVRELSDRDFKGVKPGLRENNMPLLGLYQLYCAYLLATHSQHQPETRFKFGLIIRRLRYFKNGWEFDVYRRGKDQTWHVAPLLLRIDASEAMKIQQELPSETTVETKFDDMQSEQDEVEETIVDEEPIPMKDLVDGQIIVKENEQSVEPTVLLDRSEPESPQGDTEVESFALGYVAPPEDDGQSGEDDELVHAPVETEF